jgi:hypothetical protein
MNSFQNRLQISNSDLGNSCLIDPYSASSPIFNKNIFYFNIFEVLIKLFSVVINSEL